MELMYSITCSFMLWSKSPSINGSLEEETRPLAPREDVEFLNQLGTSEYVKNNSFACVVK